MKRSILILLWASALSFLAPSVADARLFKNSKAADICIGVDNASKKDDADIKLFKCDGKPNQQWTADEVEPGIFNIVNDKSDKCMGVDHAKTTPGADIKQFGCDKSENQKWVFGTCNGAPCTVNKKSGLCLTSARVGHDVQLEQGECVGGTTQAWARF
ncbi:RICIN domain-containing protein [Pyxidicoccus sp. 3LG]